MPGVIGSVGLGVGIGNHSYDTGESDYGVKLPYGQITVAASLGVIAIGSRVPAVLRVVAMFGSAFIGANACLVVQDEMNGREQLLEAHRLIDRISNPDRPQST